MLPGDRQYVDFQLGHVQAHALRRIGFDTGFILLHVRPVQAHMALHAHAVNGHAAAFVVLEHLHHKLAFARVVHVVIVVEQMGIGVYLMGQVEGALLIFGRAHHLIPEALAPTLVLVYGFDGYVPSSYLSFYAHTQRLLWSYRASV